MRVIVNVVHTGLAQLSQRRWLLIGVFLLQLASFAGITSLASQFKAITGHEPYDTQNPLTLDAMAAQLPSYMGQGRATYLTFAAVDFVFPAAAALFLALVATALLRATPSPLAARLLRWRVPLLLLLTTLFDWLENIALLVVIANAPEMNETAAAAALVFKRLKLVGLFTSVPGVLLLALWTAAVRLWNRLWMQTQGAPT